MKSKFFLIGITICSLLFGIISGAVSLNELDYNLLVNIRIPRVLMAFLVGGLLAQSGSLLQLLLRNPLADGFTTGISSAASLGAVVALSLGFSLYLLPFVSLVFAFLGLLILFQVSKSDRNFGFTTIILAGIVLNIICSSFISFLKYFFDESIGTIVYWLMGGFYSVTYWKVFYLFAVFVAFSVYSIKNANMLNILAFDDLSAKSMGVNVKAVRIKFFIVAAGLTAFAVAFSGNIGFVGLIVPHIVRGFFGSDMKTNLLFSSVLGANFLLVADTLSRIIIPSGAELPVGVITSFVGGIFFIFLLKMRLKQIWF